MNKINILFGGASYEHEISIVSAITVKKKLEKEFTLGFIFCDQDHTFYSIDADKMTAKTFSSGAHKKSAKLQLNQNGFSQKSMFSSKLHDEVVLNLIHGGDGEDGTIAALLDFYNIRFIGPRKEASVFSYDKEYTKFYASSRDVGYIKYQTLALNERENFELKVSYPFIIKPACLGSSIGVSVVKDPKELDYALDVAFEFDNRVILEPFYDNVKEYNLAGYMTEGVMEYSIVEEPQKKEFLDFEKKYMDFSRSSEVSEAEVTISVKKKLQDAFQKLYVNQFEGALIRCDFFVIDDEVYLNEINPIPGSMANYLFDNFANDMKKLMKSLPKKKFPEVKYTYIHNISKAKGK